MAISELDTRTYLMFSRSCEKTRGTYSRTETSLQTSKTFIAPGLCEHIENISVHLLSFCLRKLSLQLKPGLGYFRWVRESDLVLISGCGPEKKLHITNRNAGSNTPAYERFGC